MLPKVVKWLAISVFLTICVVLLVDQFAGNCRSDGQILADITEVNSRNLERHVRELSAIGSRFRAVKKSAGIRPNDGINATLAEINRNLAPFGMAIPTGLERDRKLRYLEDELRKIGLVPKTMDFETQKLGTGINLIAEIRGHTRPEEILDLTAHYDTYADSPGADDNNSGVAGVLEIARIIKNRETISRTVRLIFFDLEELGLHGSRAYIRQVKNGDLPYPSICLNLEMIGFFSDLPNTQLSPARIPILFEPPTVGNTIVTVGNFDSYLPGRRLDGIFATYVPDLPVFSVSRWGDLLGNASRSDHKAYWEAGIPALMLTDTANFRNPNYHKPTDLPETLDFQRMAKVVKGAAAFTIDWAQ